VDRSFTVAGTGTVVTGTLWSGTLRVGERVTVLPGGAAARIRSLQVHGTEVEAAEAGDRTAVALASTDRGLVERGSTLVTSSAWRESWMLTVLARLLDDAPDSLETGQRVRVHVGTAEVMARCALLQSDPIAPGEEGWVQLRLEAPAVARAGDRVVLRAYSPVTTLGGGTVAEPSPAKRRTLEPWEAEALRKVLGGGAEEALMAGLALQAWKGVPTEEVPVRTGATPPRAKAALTEVLSGGGLEARGTTFGASLVREAERLMLAALDEGHRDEPLRPTVPLERLRASTPGWAAAGLADAVLGRLQANRAIELADGGARRPGFRPAPTPDQEGACAALSALYRSAGLAAPFLTELPVELQVREDLPQLLRHLEGIGTLRRIEDGLLVSQEVLTEAKERVAAELAGRTGLGPADFKDVLAVSRKHLMPLLSYLDGTGVTVRRGPVRDVPSRPGHAEGQAGAGNEPDGRGVRSSGGPGAK
jgi:selenocysteine-specific elongation factor